MVRPMGLQFASSDRDTFKSVSKITDFQIAVLITDVSKPDTPDTFLKPLLNVSFVKYDLLGIIIVRHL